MASSGLANEEHDKSVGPHPSFIEVAEPYIFEQKLQALLLKNGLVGAKEDTLRSQGVTWIDGVRKYMQLPVFTYNTACVYYHKFRLTHPPNEYNWADAAAAALFAACKIEDTLKKSREIVCAAYNMKLPPSEHLSQDDPVFDQHSRTIIGLERLMLEASGFDFRTRHPQKLVVKIAKACGYERDVTGKKAYNISLDLYRTFAPLKQTAATMAIACVELGARISEADLTQIMDGEIVNYKQWCTTRAEIMETMMDLLDLYTHHKQATVVGPEIALDTFINIRIVLNQEASAASIPRYTQWKETAPSGNGAKAVKNGVSPQSPPSLNNNSAATSTATASPATAAGKRGLDGTVRYMLDAGRARQEREVVKKFFTVEEEEYEEEVEVERPKKMTK